MYRSEYQAVYGPVSSWRLGRSLGVDPICPEREKICSFDCAYCSLGGTSKKTIDRKTFVDLEKVEEELEDALRRVEADVVTFSGMGEPTLARNLAEVIDVAKEISDLPVAVLTNSSLMSREDVRKDLCEADIVVGSMDAPDEGLLRKINRPHRELRFKEMVEGMVEFSNEFKGKFSLEVMIVPDNMGFSREIAEIVEEISPDEVQINTPLRPSPVRPLTPEELEEVQESFEVMNQISVYEAKKKKVESVVGKEKLEHLKRRGEYP